MYYLSFPLSAVGLPTGFFPKFPVDQDYLGFHWVPQSPGRDRAYLASVG